MGTNLVLFQSESAVGDALGGILFPTFAGSNQVFTGGHVGEEGNQVEEVCGGLLELDLQGALVESLDADIFTGAGTGEVLVCALDVVSDQECIGGSQLGGAGALPCKLVVAGGDLLAVRPDSVITQGESVDSVLNAFSVCGHLNGLCGSHLDAVEGVTDQTIVQVEDDVAAATGSVQLGIPGLGLAADVPDEVLAGSGLFDDSFGLGALSSSGSLSGCRCSGGCAASCKAQDHDESEKHSDDSLCVHVDFPFEYFFFLINLLNKSVLFNGFIYVNSMAGD